MTKLDPATRRSIYLARHRPEPAVSDSGVVAYFHEVAPCGHEDCAQSAALAEACTPGRVRYVATAFVGAQSKPALDYYYRSAAQRDAAVARLVDGRRAHETRKTERRNAERAPLDQPIAVGDVFYASWGYDQTNIDFYEVTAVRGASGMTVDLVKIGKANAGRDLVTADRSFRGAAFESKRVRNVDGRARITIDSVRSEGRWDGRPRYETNVMEGH